MRPAVEYLASYRAALERGWSPTTMDPTAGRVELQRIGLDPLSFAASQHDPGGTGEPITLPDGSVVPRLPGYRKWISANGGVLVERFTKPTAYGPDSPALRLRIELTEQDH